MLPAAIPVMVWSFACETMFVETQNGFMVMNKTKMLAQRIAAFLQKTGATFCDSCLIERLMIASRASFRAALETEGFAVRVGLCPDCKTRKQVITCRPKGSKDAAKDIAA